MLYLAQSCVYICCAELAVVTDQRKRSCIVCRHESCHMMSETSRQIFNCRRSRAIAHCCACLSTCFGRKVHKEQNCDNLCNLSVTSGHLFLLAHFIFMIMLQPNLGSMSCIRCLIRGGSFGKIDMHKICNSQLRSADLRMLRHFNA